MADLEDHFFIDGVLNVAAKNEIKLENFDLHSRQS